MPSPYIITTNAECIREQQFFDLVARLTVLQAARSMSSTFSTVINFGVLGFLR